MNATEEDFDSKLQKVSSDLIADLDRSLVTYIRKSDGHGGSKVRAWAKAHDIYPATCQVNLFPGISVLLKQR